MSYGSDWTYYNPGGASEYELPYAASDQFGGISDYEFQQFQDIQRRLGFKGEQYLDPFALSDPNKYSQVDAWLRATSPTANIYRNRKAALEELQGFQQKTGLTGPGGGGGEGALESGYEPIDVESIFGPLREEITRLSQRQLQLGRREINLGASRATTAATESLAGTGLGRSGVAAQGLAGIAQERERRLEGFGERVRGAEAQGQFEISAAIADKEYQEKLHERGLREEDIRSALNFRRQLIMLENQSLLQAAMNEPSFFEEWGPVFSLIGSTAGFFIGGPAGAAAGGAIGGGLGGPW